MRVERRFPARAGDVPQLLATCDFRPARLTAAAVHHIRDGRRRRRPARTSASPICVFSPVHLPARPVSRRYAPNRYNAKLRRTGHMRKQRGISGAAVDRPLSTHECQGSQLNVAERREVLLAFLQCLMRDARIDVVVDLKTTLEEDQCVLGTASSSCCTGSTARTDASSARDCRGPVHPCLTSGRRSSDGAVPRRRTRDRRPRERAPYKLDLADGSLAVTDRPRARPG